jgi:hypothetical protein
MADYLHPPLPYGDSIKYIKAIQTALQFTTLPVMLDFKTTMPDVVILQH